MVLVVPLVLVVGHPVALPARSPAIDTACDLSRSISRWLARKNIRSVQGLEKKAFQCFQCSAQKHLKPPTNNQIPS